MKKIMSWGLAATLICSFTMGVTSCDDNSDNPVPAKKKYRLVQRKEVYDDGDYAITDYSYDSQGRLKTYARVVYVAPNDTIVDANFTYTYGDHYIIEKQYEDLYKYYTLNDDGLIVDVETRRASDKPGNSHYSFQYADGRVITYQENESPNVVKFQWEGDDLMSYGQGELDNIQDNTEFTRTTLTVDNGYMMRPMVMMHEAMCMMGYYGKPSKHLEAHYHTITQTATLFLSYDHDYTYTIADGHIVEMVENSTSIVKYGELDTEITRQIITTFTYEEY